MRKAGEKRERTNGRCADERCKRLRRTYWTSGLYTPDFLKAHVTEITNNNVIEDLDAQ
jgi:hypothetical protein